MTRADEIREEKNQLAEIEILRGEVARLEASESHHRVEHEVNDQMNRTTLKISIGLLALAEQKLARARETIRRLTKEARRLNNERLLWKGGYTDGYHKGQAACAAGPWHPASEEPPEEGWYIAIYETSKTGIYQWVPCVWTDKWQPAVDVLCWAEVCIPDHIPDAGKIIEKGTEDD